MGEIGVRLVEAIALVLGDAPRAREMVARALTASGRSELPREPRQLLSFVRGHVVERLVEEIGPRSALVFLDELRASLAEPASQPVPQPSSHPTSHSTSQPRSQPTSQPTSHPMSQPTSQSTAKSTPKSASQSALGTAPERTEPMRARQTPSLAARPMAVSDDAPAITSVTVVDRNPYSRGEVARALIRCGLAVVAVDSVTDSTFEDGSAPVLAVRIHRPADVVALSKALRKAPAAFLLLVVDGAAGDVAEEARGASARHEIVAASAPIASIANILAEHIRAMNARSPRLLRRDAG